MSGYLTITQCAPPLQEQLDWLTWRHWWRQGSAHLVHLFQREAAVGLRPDGPVGNLAVRRRLSDEHVV